jgi:hypothetical protein
MENSAMAKDKSKEKRNGLGPFWPDVKTERGVKDATTAGAIALGYLIFSYAVVTVMMLSTGEGAILPITSDLEFTATLIINILLIVLAAVLMWLLLKRQNLVAASIGLVWVVAEAVVKAKTRSEALVVVSIFVVLCGINGVRGALAARRVKQATVEA